jgi:DNA invertase Pin-like site-specific DNA recombinase
MLRVATFAQEVTDAGVHIVFYSTGDEMKLGNETSRLIAVMRGFASESERRKIASRTRESAERKARRGLVAGGVVYGYRNVLSPDGTGKVRVIDEAQAAIVREVFERYAKGHGLRTICKTLTERGISSPRGQTRHRCVGAKCRACNASTTALHRSRRMGTCAQKCVRYANECSRNRTSPK